MKDQTTGLHSMMVGTILIALLGIVMTSREQPNDLDAPHKWQRVAGHEHQQGNPERSLIALIRDFASSSSEKQKSSWIILRSYPRHNLIRRLTKLKGDDTLSQAERIGIAFALCNLGADYKRNKEIITAALLELPHGENHLSDWESVLIGRLIRRGDKSLLRLLFGVSNWSDGALSADLSNTFKELLTSDPKNFLAQLSRVPRDTRRNVYELFDEEALDLNDIARIRSNLRTGLVGRHTAIVARELLATLSQVEQRIRRK